jgi:hypothetical protein
MLDLLVFLGNTIKQYRVVKKIYDPSECCYQFYIFDLYGMASWGYYLDTFIYMWSKDGIPGLVISHIFWFLKKFACFKSLHFSWIIRICDMQTLVKMIFSLKIIIPCGYLVDKGTCGHIWAVKWNKKVFIGPLRAKKCQFFCNLRQKNKSNSIFIIWNSKILLFLHVI